MSRALLLSVRFHDGRYHGTGDWPPAPARVFQALVAGAARGRALADTDRGALGWLEGLDQPVIAAPISREGRGFTNYVPNNDLDAVGGDPSRVSEIRAPKTIKPRLFDVADAFLYGWTFAPCEPAETHAQTVVKIAERLYQLGRGVDMAWAWAEVLGQDEIEERFARYRGVVSRPTKGGTGGAVLCPQSGSLASLEARFDANRRRFATLVDGKKTHQLFSQPPKPRFRAVSYDCPPTRLLFDIRKTGSGKAVPAFAPQSVLKIVGLVERVRDRAEARLKSALTDAGQRNLVERVLKGCNATEADKATRVRIVPLPSIGMTYTESSIRRVLVEVPPNCPLSAEDIGWAFSGLDLDVDDETGEVGPTVLTRADDDSAMLGHYGIGKTAARIWRTVTPAALPQSAARRRIEPSRMQDKTERKGADERIREESRAAGAVHQALRHAGIVAAVNQIRVQREPFRRQGERAESFAAGQRFPKERLWHVELTFADAVPGPLILGDGRYLGLGLMAPVQGAHRSVLVFSLPAESRVPMNDRAALLHAVRRALMALSRDEKGAVPPLFSGHEADGAPARSGRQKHIFLAAADLDQDSRIDHLIVAAPWACDSSPRRRKDDPNAAAFDRVVSSLTFVRAGRLGVIAVGHCGIPPDDCVVTRPAREWVSHTPYRPTRHAGRGKDSTSALLNDVVAECARRGLPRPEAELLDLTIGPNEGVSCRLRLRFAVAVKGPLMLGRDSHKGGGLFLAQK